MKKFLVVVFLLLVLTPTLAFAHQLKTDGSIGVVLHIDPNDDPIATTPAGFYFDFEDRDSKFSLPACQCTVFVKQNGGTLISQQLTIASLNSASFSYAFPSKGVYQVQVVGIPQVPNAFQSFNVSYDVRVDRSVTDQSTALPSWVWALVVVAGGAVLAAVVVSMRKS